MISLRALILVLPLSAVVGAACGSEGGSDAVNDPPLPAATVGGAGGAAGSAHAGTSAAGASGQGAVSGNSGHAGTGLAGAGQGAQGGQAGSGQGGGAGGSEGGDGGQAGSGEGGSSEGGASGEGGSAGASGGSKAGGGGKGGAGGKASGGAGSGAGGKGGAGGAAPKVCGCYSGDGPYCGKGVQAATQDMDCEVPVLAGHVGDLLSCEKGKWTVKKECSDGCDPGQPGETDACNLPVCACFVKDAWCGTGAAKEGLSMDPPCRVPLVPEHNDDILGCSGTKWIVKENCDKGCIEAPKGTADSCKSTSSYKLPWACGEKETCTQGNHGSSHQGTEEYAWDFGLPFGTPIHAARDGVVAYIELRSPKGSPCYNPPALDSACHNKANFIGVKHSDGTVALYMHFSSFSVKKGDKVKQGDKLGLSGNSGYTSGAHLHFQLQNDCGIWFCQSVPVKFGDAPNLAQGVSVKSGNCP